LYPKDEGTAILEKSIPFNQKKADERIGVGFAEIHAVSKTTRAPKTCLHSRTNHWEK